MTEHKQDSSPRAIAQKNVIKMIEAFEEHLTEAERSGNDEMTGNYLLVLAALYDAGLPDKTGEVKLTINFADRDEMLEARYQATEKQEAAAQARRAAANRRERRPA